MCNIGENTQIIINVEYNANVLYVVLTLEIYNLK